jgi:hypothetical protein
MHSVDYSVTFSVNSQIGIREKQPIPPPGVEQIPECEQRNAADTKFANVGVDIQEIKYNTNSRYNRRRPVKWQ